jgi:ubiquinone biosynthesis protein
MGKPLRQQLGEWVVELAPVERLVPPLYVQWRPIVHDAMVFVVTMLSAKRLAPKIVEQLELPADTPPETRLLALITKVPGLQKIGQLLARNQGLDPRLRRALSRLENGISDVQFDEIRALIDAQLGPRLAKYRVKIEPSIFSEASVSAVLRFTWRNPETGRRERGVFKVLKPYIPHCYAEDMTILQRLAGHLAARRRKGSIKLGGLEETLTEIRLLLEHEVDFRSEQQTLLRALESYRKAPGVRIPQIIQPLCTPGITALTHENGVKVTEAKAYPPAVRERIATRLAETLLAIPALSPGEHVLYHADPHAGNLLYHRRTDELVILDWALTEHLTRRQRRNVLILIAMVMLRDEDGILRAVADLREGFERGRRVPARGQEDVIRNLIALSLDRLPPFRLPSVMDAMRLLSDIALSGIKFPPGLVMFRKATFTLDGVLADVAGEEVRMDAVMARYALSHWVRTGAALWSVLSAEDWIALEWSAITFVPRMCLRYVMQPWNWLAGSAVWRIEPGPAVHS